MLETFPGKTDHGNNVRPSINVILAKIFKPKKLPNRNLCRDVVGLLRQLAQNVLLCMSSVSTNY